MKTLIGGKSDVAAADIKVWTMLRVFIAPCAYSAAGCVAVDGCVEVGERRCCGAVAAWGQQQHSGVFLKVHPSCIFAILHAVSVNQTNIGREA